MTRETQMRCSVTFHGQGSCTFLVPSFAGIFSAILHIQLVYHQDVRCSGLLQTVLLPMDEHSGVFQPGHLAVGAGSLAGQAGFVSFNGLLTFQLLLECCRSGCQKEVNELR